MVHTYSVKAEGDKLLAPNFRVGEFACHDGSDTVLVDDELPELLQQIRDHFKVPVTINSGYRTPEYNISPAVNGVPGSQHTLGTAADIVVRGVSPLEVAQYAEHLMPDKGGIGVYLGFTHVDVRRARARWDKRSGAEVAVSGWPGYKAPWYQDHADWAMARGITAKADRPNEPCTRAELWAMIHQLAIKIKKEDI